jgi:uncharacterized membrane protein
MPKNKNKRKASTHTKSKKIIHTQSSHGILQHPKLSVSLAIFFIGLAVYLLAFESQDDAMFGFAMLSLIVGIATAIYTNLAVAKKKAD